MSAGLVLRISVVEPLPADGRRDQRVSPERVRHEVPIDNHAEALMWIGHRADSVAGSGRLRFSIVAAGSAA